MGLASAADFYVAPNGNDTWSGTQAQPSAEGRDGPFATVARALQAARALRKTHTTGAITLHLAGRLELDKPLLLTPEDSGTEAAPLVLTGSDATLSGGVRVVPKVEAGVWLLAVPKESTPIRTLSVGGKLRLPSRWPTEGQFPLAGLAGADPKANYRTPADRFNYAQGQVDPTWPKFDQAEVVVLHFWVAGHYRLRDVDAGTKTIVLDRKSLRKFTEDGGGGKPGRFYLQNVAAKMSPGTFFHDRAAGQIRYRPMPGESPEKSPVIVPRLEQVIRFEGQPDKGTFVKHVHLLKMHIEDSTFDHGPKIAGDLQAAQNVPGAVWLRGAQHCRIENCTLRNLGGYGIELAAGCRHNRLSGNTLSDLAAGGIRLSGGAAGSPEAQRTGENTLTDNHLHHLGRVFHAGVGILSQHADRNRIAHNHIHHLDYTAISVGWVWGYAPSVSHANRIEANRIHDIGQKVLSDMGGIYMLGTSPGTVVRGNVLHDIESFGYGGWGIYTDEGSTAITIENNLVYRTKSGGFHQHYGKENIVRNNIFAFGREGQIIRSRMEPHRSFTLERNVIVANGTPLLAKNWKDDKYALDSNLYWDVSNKAPAFPGGDFASWQKRGNDAHSLIADPLFVDAAKGDFRLKDGSPALKIGFKPFDFSQAGIRPQASR
jgi:parallel beta-helix repeat protein